MIGQSVYIFVDGATSSCKTGGVKLIKLEVTHWRRLISRT